MSWMKSMGSARQGVGLLDSRSPNKSNRLRKPLLHFILCFLAGFAIGLTPFNTSNTTVNPGIKPGVTTKRMVSEQLNSSIEISAPKMNQEQQEHAETQSVELETTASENKLVIVVTPTYTRPFQALYLTRLAHTLKLVDSPLLWIVVEMPGQSLETASLLRKTGVMYRHLGCDRNLTNIKDRGTLQRNLALQHIERHQLDGIVYFADDDNFYSLELFQQLRQIERFGTWPVAMLQHGKSKAIIEGPVCDGNRVIGWHTNEKSKRVRRFHVDMAGFGFNSTILWDPRRWKRPNNHPVRQLDTVKEGFQETTFIEQLVEDENQMEGLPSGCSKIMVWHLHLESETQSYPTNWKMDQMLEPVINL